jgi:hypothetical protein
VEDCGLGTGDWGLGTGEWVPAVDKTISCIRCLRSKACLFRGVKGSIVLRAWVLSVLAHVLTDLTFLCKQSPQ